MSSLGMVPASEPVKKEFSWKRLFIKAAGFGAGFAVMFVLCALAINWYSSRPKPPKPWNKEILKAEFRNVTVQKDHFWFYYVVENTSVSDYRLNAESQVNLTVRSGSHLAMCEKCLELPELPLFIPAGQKMLVPIELNYTVPQELKGELGSSPDDKETEIVRAYINKNFKHLDGFIIYDDATRFELELPGGWKSKR